MKGKQNDTAAPLRLIATRIPEDTKAAFEDYAKKQDRSAAAQLRRLIEKTLKEAP